MVEVIDDLNSIIDNGSFKRRACAQNEWGESNINAGTKQFATEKDSGDINISAVASQPMIGILHIFSSSFIIRGFE